MDKNSATATPAPMAKAKGTIQSSPSLRMASRIAKHHCGRQGTRSRDNTIRSAITALATSPPRAASSEALGDVAPCIALPTLSRQMHSLDQARRPRSRGIYGQGLSPGAGPICATARLGRWDQRGPRHHDICCCGGGNRPGQSSRRGKQGTRSRDSTAAPRRRPAMSPPRGPCGSGWHALAPHVFHRYCAPPQVAGCASRHWGVSCGLAV